MDIGYSNCSKMPVIISISTLRCVIICLCILTNVSIVEGGDWSQWSRNSRHARDPSCREYLALADKHNVEDAKKECTDLDPNNDPTGVTLLTFHSHYEYTLFLDEYVKLYHSSNHADQLGEYIVGMVHRSSMETWDEWWDDVVKDWLWIDGKPITFNGWSMLYPMKHKQDAYTSVLLDPVSWRWFQTKPAYTGWVVCQRKCTRNGSARTTAGIVTTTEETTYTSAPTTPFAAKTAPAQYVPFVPIILVSAAVLLVLMVIAFVAAGETHRRKHHHHHHDHHKK